jgi:hypothetical protein
MIIIIRLTGVSGRLVTSWQALIIIIIIIMRLPVSLAGSKDAARSPGPSAWAGNDGIEGAAAGVTSAQRVGHPSAQRVGHAAGAR